MESIEKIINPETLQLYTTRYEEKHNIASDELHVYVVWSKLKQLSLEDKPTTEPTPIDKEDNPLALLPEKQQKVSSVLEEVLTYPEPAKQKKSHLDKEKVHLIIMPKHLSSDQVIAYLEEKKLQNRKRKMRKQAARKKGKRGKRNMKKRRSRWRERKREQKLVDEEEEGRPWKGGKDQQRIIKDRETSGFRQLKQL